MNAMIQELNSISRMAVIENATVTELLICDYIKIIKYRWNEEEKMIAAAKEIEIIKRSCELYQKTTNQSFTYKVQEETDVKMVFIPHYTILSVISGMLQQLRNKEGNVNLVLHVKEINGQVMITILFEGSFPFNTYYETMMAQNASNYESVWNSFSRWTAQFGADTWNVVNELNSFAVCVCCS